jgi:hypothetical protein
MHGQMVKLISWVQGSEMGGRIFFSTLIATVRSLQAIEKVLLGGWPLSCPNYMASSMTPPRWQLQGESPVRKVADLLPWPNLAKARWVGGDEM